MNRKRSAQFAPGVHHGARAPRGVVINDHHFIGRMLLFDEIIDAQRSVLPLLQVKEFWPEISLGGAFFSPGHLALWVLLLVVWVGGVPGPFTWWSVPAALAVAASHTALVLLGGRPTSGDLAVDTWSRVRRRLGTVGAITVAVAVLAQLVRSIRVPGHVALAVMALVAVSAWLWWGTRQTGSDAEPDA